MAGFPTKFLPFYCLIFLLVAFHNTPVNAGCPRGSRCSDRSGLRREWRRTIDFLVPSSRLLTGLTYRALNYMNSKFNITDFCSPTCNSLALAVMADMNLTSSSCTNASTSKVLEFHRRVSLGYSQHLSESLAVLSRIQNDKTLIAYLKSLEVFMQGTLKDLITKAVEIDQKFNGLPPLDTTAGQQLAFTAMRNASSVNTVAYHISQCVLNDLLEVSYQMIVDFFKIRSGSLRSAFLPWCNVAMTNCLAKSPAWPCRSDKDIKTSLSEALIRSRVLAEEISVVRSNMSRRWPPSPFNATNIGRFGPRHSLNKTVAKPEQILKANIQILRTFITLLNNSTNQLKRFPVAQGLVTSQLVGLKGQTRTVISHLKRTVTIIKSSRRGKRSIDLQGGQQKNYTANKPVSPSVQTKPLNSTSMGSSSLAIEDVAFRTQIILVDLYANVLNLASDLRKIAAQTCN